MFLRLIRLVNRPSLTDTIHLSGWLSLCLQMRGTGPPPGVCVMFTELRTDHLTRAIIIKCICIPSISTILYYTVLHNLLSPCHLLCIHSVSQLICWYHKTQWDKGEIIHKEENKTTKTLKVSILHNRSLPNKDKWSMALPIMQDEGKVGWVATAVFPRCHW